MNKYKTFSISFPLFISLFFFVAPVSAAAPDGFGPWADKVISAHQGLMKNGLPVPAIRSNPYSALGVAENDTVEGKFYSLGFGGKIILGFKNGIKNGVVVVEATNPAYPLEKAKIEVSPDKEHWFTAGTLSQDGKVSIPRRAGCIHYVRIKDVSNPADFSDPTADGYDVDGVKGEGEKCSIKHHRYDKNYKFGFGNDDKNYWGPYSAKKEQEIDNGE